MSKSVIGKVDRHWCMAIQSLCRSICVDLRFEYIVLQIILDVKDWRGPLNKTEGERVEEEEEEEGEEEED